MPNAKYSTPSYETPCLVRVKDFGWIEAELCLEEDTGDMYYPLCGSNVIKYEVWYSQVSESFYSVDVIDYWVYIHNLKELDFLNSNIDGD